MSDDSNTPCNATGVAAYFCVKGAAEAIEFYQNTFGAKQTLRLENPDGKIAHAETQIGETVLMLADEWPDFGALSPVSIGGSPVKFTIAVEDADVAFAHAIACGCSELRAVEDQFYGYRGGMVSDPYGYNWFIQHKVEDLSETEMQARWSKVQAGM